MISNDVLAMIYTGENDYSLRELTRNRPVCAVPIGGRYRVIDVLLSNMVHSGIMHIGMIAQRNYHSLMDHCGSGKEWDLNRKREGLITLPPFSMRDNTGRYQGVLHALHANSAFLYSAKERYVIITQSHIVYNCDYTKVVQFHIDSGADITVLYDTPAQSEVNERVDRAYFDIGPNGQVMDVEVSPEKPRYYNVHMDFVVIEKNLLMRLIDENASHGYNDFKRDVLMKHYRDLRIFGYPFDGYAARIDCLENYYQLNMDLLKPEVREQIFPRERPVYTKVKDEVPARYMRGAKVSNSLVADGCIIEGTVENSVLFRGVKIGRGAVVRNSIIMQSTEARENTELDAVIADKAVIIGRERRLIGSPAYPVVIGKGVMI